GDGHAGHLRRGGAGVELLAELHNVDLCLAECRADWRRGRGLSAGDLKLDVSSDFLRCHGVILCMVLAAGTWPAADFWCKTLSQVCRFSPAGCGDGSLLFRLVDFGELDFDRGGAAEDRDHDLERLTIFVDVVHGAVEVGEGSFVDADLLALLELDLHGRL